MYYLLLLLFYIYCLPLTQNHVIIIRVGVYKKQKQILRIWKEKFMEKHHHERSTFSGKLGFVLSAAGASVGLEIYGDFLTLRQSTAVEYFY